jgi:hypothetical protein
MRRLFRVKKDAAGGNNKLRANTANTILSLREGIVTLEKQWVFIWWKNDVQQIPYCGRGGQARDGAGDGENFHTYRKKCLADGWALGKICSDESILTLVNSHCFRHQIAVEITRFCCCEKNIYRWLHETREEHLEKIMEEVILEAKAKMAKNDEKGTM